MVVPRRGGRARWVLLPAAAFLLQAGHERRYLNMPGRAKAELTTWPCTVPGCTGTMAPDQDDPSTMVCDADDTHTSGTVEGS